MELQLQMTFKRNDAFLMVLVLALPIFTGGITTTHHDKPNEAKIAVMAMKMKENSSTNTFNASIAVSERQKRLLPYYNFYLANGFNQPDGGQVVIQNNQKYQTVVQKPTNYQPFQTKYADVVPLNQQPKITDAPQVLYQTKSKFTPFSESNAIPGPFIPMQRKPQQNENDFPPPQQYQINKVPNYSTIYDKLAELQRIQQNLASRPQSFNQNLRVPQYAQYATQNFVPKQEFNYIPISNYQDHVNAEQHKSIQPTKTILHGTYTATTIDISPNPPSRPNEHYEQIPPPTKPYKNQHKIIQPYQQIQQNSKPYASEEHIPSHPLNSRHQDHVQPITQEEQLQYKKDQQNFSEQKTLHRKPIIVLEQKPIRIQPIKVYPENLKGYIQNIEKPIIYVQPNHYQQQNVQGKGYPVPIVPTKLEPVKYRPVQKYVSAQKLEPVQTYKPVLQNYVPKYEIEQHQKNVLTDEQPYVYDENRNSLSQILKKLQESNALPQTLTPDNIDNSIKTLVRILTTLKNQESFKNPIVVADENISDYEDEAVTNEADIKNEGHSGDISGTVTQIFPAVTQQGGTPGKPGIDYPALSSIPPTKFNCKTQRYKGFFGDPDTHCQVWHYCDLNGGQASFLCPNGTIFSQVALTCDWWYNVKCSTTAQLYVLNERLYKYILPLSPKFPEDYSGPLVDKYLALKFKEMEDKMRKQKKGKQKLDDDETDELDEEEEENLSEKKETDDIEYGGEESTEETSNVSVSK